MTGISSVTGLIARAIRRTKNGVLDLRVPLNKRERIVYSVLAFFIAIGILAPRVIATTEDLGTIFSIPVAECRSDIGWLNAATAAGQSAVLQSRDRLDYLAIDDVARAEGDAVGSLICSGFTKEKPHTQVDTTLHLAIGAFIDQADSEATDDSLQLSTASTLPLRVDEPIEGAMAANQYPAIDDETNIDGSVLRISLSDNNGESWTQFHTISEEIYTATEPFVSITLPAEFGLDLANLTVQIETMQPLSSSQTLLIESVFATYAVGENKEFSVALDGELSGDVPVLASGDAISAELQLKKQHDGFWQGAGRALGNAVNGQDDVALDALATVIDAQGSVVVEQAIDTEWQDRDLAARDSWQSTIDMPSNANPGRYTLIVEATDNDGATVTSTQDFLWGVLATNPDKSRYAVGETALFGTSVLNETGHTVCDAQVTISIDGPESALLSTSDNSIAVSNTCEIYGSSIQPDYISSYQFARAGDYTITTTAESANGVFTIRETLSVTEQPNDIQVRRIGPTRVYPPITYPMQLEIFSNSDQTITISERVPAVFNIFQDVLFAQSYDRLSRDGDDFIIEWDISLTANEPTLVGYSFKAPEISPEFYLLGPAAISSSDGELFNEMRNWQIAGDAVGDIAIYQEAAGGETITTSPSNQTWDSTVTEGTAFTLSGSNDSVNLGDAGHYLAVYNISANATSARNELQGVIDISGTDSPYGRSTCYTRNTESVNQCWASGSGIFEVSAGDDITIEALRTDSVGGTLSRRSNESGFSLLKLDDSWDYARIHESGGGQSFDSNGFTAVEWDTNDEIDSGSFTHSTGANTDEIVLEASGHYLVSTSHMLQNSSGSARRSNEGRLTLNTAEIDGTRTTAYLRGTGSTQDHATHYIGIIEATAGDVLRYEIRCSSEACGGITNVGDQTAISIAKLPDSADFIRLHESGGGQTVTATNDPVLWDTQDEVDSSFSHNTVTNSSRITVSSPGDYMFFSSFFAERSVQTEDARHQAHWEWALNGTVSNRSSFAKYDRGAQGGTGTFSSGNSGAIFYNGLNASDYVELQNTNEGTGIDASNTFISDRYAVQGVRISSLFGSSPLTQQLHYRWRDDTTALNTAGGFLDVEDGDAIPAASQGDVYRLRLSTANVGSANEAAARQYELQFALKTGSCSASTGWTGIADTANDAFDMFDSANITSDGQSTTALLANTEALTFVAGAGHDVTDTTTNIGPLSANNYSEIEYAFTVNKDATVASTYCFRLYDAASSNTLDAYARFPELQIAGNEDTIITIGEAGTIASAVDGGWTTVNFTNSYTTPVIVGTSNTHNGENGLVFEARNVMSTSAEVRLCESEGSLSNGCDTHASETIGYLVADAALSATIDGFEAGTFSASGAEDANNVTTGFSESFSTTPRVFANLNSNNSAEEPTEVVINSVTTSNFNGGICNHQQGSVDDCDAGHPTETVGYIAFEPGNEPFDSIEHDSGSASIANSTWTPVSFSPTFTATPALIVASQTDTGGQDVEIDEGRLVTTSGAEIRFCEIDSGDSCDTHNPDTVVWAAFEQDTISQTAALEQDTYRWYENIDALQPTTPLDAEDTAISSVANTEVVRLRLGVESGSNLDSGAVTTKLQYKAGSVCSAAGAWTDVGAAGSGAIWRGVDNATPNDGDTISTTLLAGSTVGASYEESNNSISNPNPINIGDRAEYDWVLQNNGAASNETYCFRLVTASGTEINYSQYPSLTTTSEPLRQEHYRWRDDSTALNTSGGFLAAEDSGIVDATKATVYRLRTQISWVDAVADSNTRSYQLQWADRTPANTSCTDLTTWTALSVGGDAFELIDSAIISGDGESITSGLLTATGTFGNGEALESSDATSSQAAFTANTYNEYEFSIAATDSAITGRGYCFRVFDSENATTLDAYATYPELTLAAVQLDDFVGEFGQTTLTDDIWTTISFSTSYTDPVVVASPRYAQTSTAVVERAPRIRNISSADFEIKVDNHDNTVTGVSTVVDYVVFERGNHVITTDAGSFQVVADTHNTSTFVVCNATSSGTGGDLINFPITFNSAPVVLNTISSDSDTTFVNSHVHGTAFTSNPTVTQMRLGLDRGFDTCTHGAEDIDYIALEPFHDTHNGVEMEVSISTDNVLGGFTTTGYSNAWTTPFATAPLTAVNAVMRVDGVNGGISLLHTGGTELSTTNYNTTIEEFGPSADRAHTDEQVGIFAFAATSGSFTDASSSSYQLDQDTYQIYENIDALQPITAKEPVNTKFASALTAEQFRIRMSVQLGEGSVPLNALQMRLQFTTGTVCSVATGWADVGAPGAGTVWRGVDNPSVADGATLGASLLNGGGNTLFTYEETNNSASNPSAITAAGDRAEYDWAIENNGAVAGSNYCFRMVRNDASEIQYTQYPQLELDQPPNIPADLAQWRIASNSEIVLGGYGNETTVEFRANVSGPNSPEDLQLCVEVKPIASAFVDTADACGTAITYNGTATEATVQVAGLSDASSYHWQAYTLDENGNTSAWVSFGGNLDGPPADVDFILDTSAPTGGTVFDGSTLGVDIDFNSGSLDAIDANWSGFDASASGLDFYEYAIGTTIGGDDVLTWQNNGTATSFSETGLSLTTSAVYYVSVRVNDNASNTHTVTSDGVLVTPTLSFTVDDTEINYGNLNASNSYTQTDTTVLTTSTNAFNGYYIRAFIDGNLQTDSGAIIGVFDGGTYGLPDVWQSGDTGYGYTSNDPDINGVNLFNDTPCLGGGSGSSCYAPWAISAPGDIVADNNTSVTGTPIVAEAFTITQRVTADAAIEAGVYQTEIIYTVTARY